MDCFDKNSLYGIFSQVIRLQYKRAHSMLEKVGAYPGQPPMLFALCAKDGQNQKELAEKLNIKPATITVMLNRMEKSELVERKQDPNDQRVSRVYITDKGREVFKEVLKIANVLSEECFDNFTQEEKIIFRRLLMQIKDNLIKACDKNLDG